MRPLLESCVTTAEEAVASWKAGAHRLELCEHLELDGLTPTLALLEEVRAAVPLPIMAMVRPRPGSFCMTQEEVQGMQQQMKELRHHGADGFVLGVVNALGTIDIPSLESFLAAAEGLPVTFHRAFDGLANPQESIRALGSFGVTSVLCSGGPGTAWEHREAMKNLIAHAPGGLEIIVAGSVRGEHVAELLRHTRASAVHARASAIPRIAIALGLIA